MKYFSLIICCSVLIAPGCSKSNHAPTSPETETVDTTHYVVKPQHDIPWPSLAPTAWPKALHDAQCTGRSSYNGPTKGVIKYSIPLNEYTTDAVMNSDTAFYIVSDSSLYAITLSGQRLWRVSLGTYPPIENTPMIGSDGTIYIGVLSGMSAYRNDGTLLWHVLLDGWFYLKSCGIDLNGNIYVVTINGTLYAISKSGNVLWHRNAPMGSFNTYAGETISFSPDGSRLYVGASTAQQSLYVLNTSGDILQSDSLGGEQSGAISVDVDGNVYSYFGNYLMSISSSGTVRWRIAAEANWNVTIDPNGDIAYLSNDSLTLVDNEGQKRWSVPVHPQDFITHLVCDAQGTIFMETGNDYDNYDVQAVGNTGKVLWTLNVSAYVKEAGPSLTKDGYLLFPHSDYYPTTKQMFVIE